MTVGATWTIQLIDEATATDEAIDLFARCQSTVRREPYGNSLNLPPAVYWARRLRASLSTKAKFWVALDEGRPVGRIGANLSPTREETGYVGFFEVDVAHPNAEAIALALLDGAHAWLKSEGVSDVYGPIDTSTWFSYRFQVHSPSDKPFVWEPFNPPEYIAYFEKAGFTVAQRYFSRVFEGFQGSDTVAALMQGSYDHALSQGFKFEPFEDDISNVIRDIYEVSKDSFADNYLFEPITYSEFFDLNAPSAAKLDRTGSYFAIDSNGKRQGFIFSFIDRGYIVVKTLTVSKEMRRQGLSMALMFVAMRAAAERGIHDGVAALVKDGNLAVEFIQQRPHSAGFSAWHHEYVLLRRSS